ncbi:MAG: T9SS type A sorting domain-containing protein [Saprospiraceae bacterium]
MKQKYQKFQVLIFFIFGLFESNIHQLVSQNYGAAWIVGYSNDSSFYPKYGKSEINFSNGKIEINYRYGEEIPNLGFTNSSLAYKDGTLRYFTDGYRIFDQNQKIIQDGDSINYGRIWRDYYDEWPSEYNHYFIPMPGKEEIQTIMIHFTIDYHPEFIKRYTYTPELKYSLIEFDSLKNKSFIKIKEKIIAKGDFVEKHMALTKHANGRDWWIITEDFLSNNHNIYLLDTAGIKLYTTQKIGTPTDSFDWTGNSIFTQNGEMFIKYLRGYQIQIFDFDRCSGILSNPKVIINEKGHFKDLCFITVSPNNRFLYLNSDSTIWQYDLFSSDIKNSETVIGEWDGYFFKNRLTTSFNQISLAPDGKIYVSCRSSSIYLHVINNPNEKGLNCDFQLRQEELPAFMFGNLPTPPNYNLTALKMSTCDTLLKNYNYINEEFRIYPNLIDNYFIIDSYSHFDYRLRIVDMIGNVIKEFKNNNINHYDVSDIPSGIYIIQIEVKDGQYSKKIIIN